MPQDIKETADTAPGRENLGGLENVRAAARDLAERVRDTGIALGEFADRELAFAVGLAEDIRDKTVSAELMKEARALPVVSGFRATTHRVVDLGFDAVAVGVKVGGDALDDFLAPRGDVALAVRA